MNLTVACPSGLYSTPGSDNESDCRCPDFSRSSWKGSSAEACTCNDGYYRVGNSSNPLAGWHCAVSLIVLVCA